MRVIATIGVPRRRRAAQLLRAFAVRMWRSNGPDDNRPPTK